MTAKVTLIHEWLQKGMRGVCLKNIPIIYKTGNQIRPVEFAPGFLSSSLDKLPLKNPWHPPEALTSFSQGLNPH